MISFSIIQKAKSGDKEAINCIIQYYLKKIKKISDDRDFVQLALINVLEGIYNFENKKI